MPQVQTYEHMRRYLWTVLEQGGLRNDPDLAETVLTALQSPREELIPRIFNLVRIQHIELNKTEPEEAKGPLFKEPGPGVLKGEIFLGNTVPSGHPVHLPLRSFGQLGHILIAGVIGSGKSTILNLISAQLMIQGIVTTVYDTLDQAARTLVPVVPEQKLNVLDFRNYRRNFLIGPESMSQMDWIRRSFGHLMESLEMSPVTMNYLLELCQKIVSQGKVATIPRVIELAQKSESRSQSARALLNRFPPLVMSGAETFLCERGIDLERLFSRSCILNIKDAPEMIRTLVYNDHYSYLTKSREVLNDWRLKNVFVFHEAGTLMASVGDSFLTMIREARNYGIGLVFADQAPQLQHPSVRSTLGTKGLLRLEDPASLEGFRVGMDLAEEQRNFILNMPNRCMLLRRPDIGFPFLVQIPKLS
jgi:hypothetical protein